VSSGDTLPTKAPAKNTSPNDMPLKAVEEGVKKMAIVEPTTGSIKTTGFKTQPKLEAELKTSPSKWGGDAVIYYLQKTNMAPTLLASIMKEVSESGEDGKITGEVFLESDDAFLEELGMKSAERCTLMAHIGDLKQMDAKMNKSPAVGSSKSPSSPPAAIRQPSVGNTRPLVSSDLDDLDSLVGSIARDHHGHADVVTATRPPVVAADGDEDDDGDDKAEATGKKSAPIAATTTAKTTPKRSAGEDDKKKGGKQQPAKNATSAKKTSNESKSSKQSGGKKQSAKSKNADIVDGKTDASDDGTSKAPATNKASRSSASTDSHNNAKKTTKKTDTAEDDSANANESDDKDEDDPNDIARFIF